jgi:peptidoglycan endopeptidase LytE
VERWRIAVAIVAALAALPLLAIDNVSSADPERPLVEPGDPAVDLLASRAAAWGVAHELQRQRSLDEAIAVGQQVQAEEAARLAEEARAAATAAEAARKAEQARRAAEAARKADADKRAQAARRTTTVAPPARTTTPPPREGDPTAEQWAALRQCEASGDYGAVSSGGRFRGAYQFDQATWDLIARQSFPHLVGVDPATASPADQDSVALALYHLRGASPWPRCGGALR